MVPAEEREVGDDREVERMLRLINVLQPLGDIFGTNKPVLATPSAGTKFLAALQSAKKQQSVSTEIPHQTELPVRPPRKQHSPAKVEELPLHTVLPDRTRENPTAPDRPSFADSGIFSASQPNSQALYHFKSGLGGTERGLGLSQAWTDGVTMAGIRQPLDRRDTQNSPQSFHTAESDTSALSDAVEIVPVEESAEAEQELLEKHGALPQGAKIAAPEPRRSGRLAKSPSPSKPADASDIANHKAHESMSTSRVEFPAKGSAKSSAKSPAGSPVKPTLRPDTDRVRTEAQEDIGDASHPNISPAKPDRKDAPADGNIDSVEHDLEDAADSSDPPSPEVPLARKSSLNFASLPAREPLTSKKSIGPKAARESNSEQLRLNGGNRASWMSRKGDGKSLGGSSKSIVPSGNTTDEEEDGARELPGQKRKSNEGSEQSSKKLREDNDIVEVVEEKETTKVPTKGGDDSDGETRRNRNLNSKASTQRLHDKIQQLGKLNAARTARSFPAPAQQPTPDYPELPQYEGELTSKGENAGVRGDQEIAASQPQIQHSGAFEVDEEEWIPAKPSYRPQLVRSQTEKLKPTPKSPDSPKVLTPIINNSNPRILAQRLQVPERASSVKTYDRVASPPRSARKINVPTSPSSPLKTVAYPSVENVLISPAKSLSPKKTPGDGTLIALTGQTTSMFQKAKDIWVKNSASANVKLEFSSPASKISSSGKVIHDHPPKEASPLQVLEKKELYPNLENVIEPASVEKEPAEQLRGASAFLQKLREGRQMRSSPSSADEASKKSPNADVSSDNAKRSYTESLAGPALASSSPREVVLPQPRSPPKSQPDEAELRREREFRRKQQEETLRQEKEELRRKQEELQRQQELRQEEKKRKAQESSPASEDTDEAAEQETERTRATSSAEPERPASRLQKTSSFRKPADSKRPLRLTKEPPKIRPAPVSIKMTTASQKEMQDQRNKASTIPSQSLVSALKSSFEAQSSQPDSSQSSLHNANSNGSIRSNSSNSNGPPKQVKALQAAANQRKKEQEERERKAAQKRENERRRQENQRKQEEEQKRLQAQKRTTPGPSTLKSVSRAQTVSNVRSHNLGTRFTRLHARTNTSQLRQKSEEPEGKKLDYQAASIHNKVPLAKGPVKRPLQAEPAEESSARNVPSRLGVPTYQQEGHKKRRTNEHEERAAYQMAPPIRNSAVKKVHINCSPIRVIKGTSLLTCKYGKKELAPKNALPHGYASASAAAASRTPGPSTLKSGKAAPPAVPQVESVKYSTDKIKFATTTPGQSNFKTPAPNPPRGFKTPAANKDSPIYQNGELIDLPDIPTEYVSHKFAAKGARHVLTKPFCTVPKTKTMTTTKTSGCRNGLSPLSFVPCSTGSRPLTPKRYLAPSRNSIWTRSSRTAASDRLHGFAHVPHPQTGPGLIDLHPPRSRQTGRHGEKCRNRASGLTRPFKAASQWCGIRRQ